MKIEKLTENKIRVIIYAEEMEEQNLNFHDLLIKSMETQNLFLTILKKAEKEVNFCTDGCKLLIESFSSSEDIFVFMITKYDPNSTKKKKLIAKRKFFPVHQPIVICSFPDFDTFCECCSVLNRKNHFEINKMIKKSSLYLWKNTYYLLATPKNTSHQDLTSFYCLLSEFGEITSYSAPFSHKLLEHGTAIIKKDAINIGMNFFVN